MADANIPSSRIRTITDETPSGATHVVGVFRDADTDPLVDLDRFDSSSGSSSSEDSSTTSSSASESSDSSGLPGGSSVEDEDGWDTGAESTDDDNDASDDDDDDDTAGAIVAGGSLDPSFHSFDEAPTMEQIQQALVEPVEPHLAHIQLNEQEQYMEDEYDTRQQQYYNMEEEEEHDAGRIDPYQECSTEQRFWNDHYPSKQQEQEQFTNNQNEPYMTNDPDTPLHNEPFMDEEDPLVVPWQILQSKSLDETMQDTFEDEFDLDNEHTQRSPFLVLLPRIICCTCVAIIVLIVVLVVVIRGKGASPPLPVPITQQHENQTTAPVAVTPVPVTSAPSASPTGALSMAPSITPSDVPTTVPTLAPTVDPWIVEIEHLETDDGVSLETFHYQVDISADGSTMVVVSLDQAQSTETVQIYSLKGNAWQEVAFTTATETARRYLQPEALKQSRAVLSNSGKELLISNKIGTTIYQLNAATNVWTPKGQDLSSSGTMAGDGKSVVTGTVFYSWNGSTWVEDPTRSLPFGNFEMLSLSSDGSVLAAIVVNSNQKSLHAFRWEESAGQWNETILSNASIHFGLSSDGTTIVEAGNEAATVFRFVENKWTVYGSPIIESYNEVAVSADGLTFAAAVESGWAQIYDYNTVIMEWIETAPAKVVAPSGSGISGVWLSGDGRRLGLGVVPRFESGTSFVLTLSRQATGPTTSPTVMPGKECNGLVNLCEARVNEIMFAAATKSKNVSASDYLTALELGVRGFHWDISTDLDFASEVGAVIFDYVHDNPNEVLSLHLQIDQVDEQTVEDLLAGIENSISFEIFGEYFYKQSPDLPEWPTLGEMIETNQRVILFVNSSSSEVFNNWNAYVTEIHDQTVCDNQSSTDFDAIYISTNDTAALLSDLHLYVNECKMANFVFFDYFDSDNAASVVEAIQRYNTLIINSTPGPTSISPSLAPSLSPHPTSSVAPSDMPTLVPSSEPSISASPTFGPTLTLQPSTSAEPTSSFIPTSSLYPTGTSFPTGTLFPTLSLEFSATSLPAEKPVATVAPTASQTTSGTNIFDRPSE